MAARGRRGGAHEEEHVNHERWLVSYADMMTLLMVLFIVLFAISQVDQKKFAALKDGLSSGFGATVNVPVTGGTGIIDNDGVVPAPVSLDVGLGVAQKGRTDDDQTAYGDGKNTKDANGTGGTKGKDHEDAVKEVKRLGTVEQQIKAALKQKGLQDDVRFKVTDRGLVVALVSDDVFFDSASATIRPRGRDVLDAVGPVIRPLADGVAVEGHANHLTLTSSAYPTNWELSGARAAGVVRYLIENEGLRATRLGATGYGSSRPLYPVSDPRSIRFNRRVDLVLVSDKSPSVRALLPKLAPELSNL